MHVNIDETRGHHHSIYSNDLVRQGRGDIVLDRGDPVVSNGEVPTSVDSIGGIDDTASF
jgi:hypothetical protein